MNKYENTMMIVVDEQEDFANGTLGSDAAKATIPVVTEMVTEALDEGMPEENLVFTKDTHQKNYLQTTEGKNLPIKHCIENTPGWQLVEPLRRIAEQYNCIVINKITFGTFALIQTIKPGTKRIILVGLDTDICVISNALILKAAFPDIEIIIYENACAGVTKESHEAALIVAKACQIKVITYKKGGEIND